MAHCVQRGEMTLYAREDELMTTPTSKFLSLLLLAFALVNVGCTDAPPDSESQNLAHREDGVLSRLFGKLTGAFSEKAAEDVPIAPLSPYTPPGNIEDPAVDELFDTMGLVEVQPDENPSYDGALVGVYEHFPDDDDPNDFYDEVCFFAKSPDSMPSAETMFWAEMYGFRPTRGGVSDVEGNAIGMEVVGGENIDGAETRVIYYVNGVMTGTDAHCETLQQISDLTGAVTIGVMNESDGQLKDFFQTGLDRFTVQLENKLAAWGIKKTVEIHENEAATLLTNVIVQRLRAGKSIEIWAHSQGGAVTSLALHRALRTLTAEGRFPVERDGEVDVGAIEVITFGSAAPQWPEGMWPDGPKYTHYVHLRDATPSALGIGAWGGYTTLGAQRSGGDASVVFFDGDPEQAQFTEVANEDANVSLGELEMRKYHSVSGCYLKMHESKKGSWVKEH
jgi:hypothetical protein